ncbi:hypothetical protein TcWFU_004732 [Taenia crassiceps]|uniref:Uncharacterized protein n=1 Tax=Taenia crassiceps TaxID=6207 RepID=A0ABR4QDM1_9CEST
MATVSTVPADLVSAAAASNASAPDLLHYDSILADACAFNRRLRKGRVDRPNFFDTATQIAQRPAPWLHRSVQARIKRPYNKTGLTYSSGRNAAGVWPSDTVPTSKNVPPSQSKPTRRRITRLRCC